MQYAINYTWNGIIDAGSCIGGSGEGFVVAFFTYTCVRACAGVCVWHDTVHLAEVSSNAKNEHASFGRLILHFYGELV